MREFVKEKAINFPLAILILVFSSFIYGQSTDVNFPTAVTSDTISGRINARDIGDSRLTSHYYVFEGTQGDIFLKIESSNLDGSIDIYYAENLRPLTRVSLYSDSSSPQTGREIYLRKPEKLILRVEGRSPNDNSATYSISFSGSFKSIAGKTVPQTPAKPQLTTDSESEVKVNSVGTIIETKETSPAIEKKSETVCTRNREAKTVNTPEPVSTAKTAPVKKETEKKPAVKNTTGKASPGKTTAGKSTATSRRRKVASKPVKTEEKPKQPSKEEQLEQALENVTLIVEFKDGKKIERPMGEVLKFGIDKGILTIINKNGAISRHSILEIAKITVE